MNYLQYGFSTNDPAIREMLVAFLDPLGFEGFEEDDHDLKAFIREEKLDETGLTAILKKIPVQYTRTIIPQQNWNAQWESSFEPIIINDLAGIRAGFHKPIQKVEHEIIITPKMSFGTGHHATTYLMIEQMAGLDLFNKSVLDFGTGTAILAILAEKMGASAIDAIDNDDWSIENAKENFEANGCSKIKLHKADTISAKGVYDIILANINLNVILSNLNVIGGACRKGSLILLSGFFKTDEDRMLAALEETGIVHSGTRQRGEWISILCQMN